MINVIQKIVLILKWPIGHSNYLRFNYSLSEIRSLVSYFIICIDSPTKHLKDQFNKPVIWVEHPPLKFSAGAIISKAPYFPWEDQPCVFFPGRTRTMCLALPWIQLTKHNLAQRALFEYWVQGNCSTNPVQERVGNTICIERNFSDFSLNHISLFLKTAFLRFRWLPLNL